VTRAAVPGLDLDRLDGWFDATLPDLGRPTLIEVLAGGKSNLTYRVETATGAVVLRRPPLGHVLATAHDMGREYQVMSALGPTEVPVPRVLALCSDTDVIGAPFYVMEYVAGQAHRDAGALAELGAERTRRISESVVDALVALHRVDPAAVGLDGFGRAEGYAGRQVRRWQGQLAASYSRDLPLAEELHRLLAEAVPARSRGGIVHGDFRLDNTLIADDSVAAIIDWEMATLGDPLCDLALMLVYNRLAPTSAQAVIGDAALADGFLTEAEIIDRYAAGCDTDLPDLGFYLGLASFKLAAILEGIHYRYLQGQTVGSGFEEIGTAVNPLLEAGITAMKEND
jgi:aminoglycoside phosphotransferase (APT) family kinase protein